MGIVVLFPAQCVLVKISASVVGLYVCSYPFSEDAEDGVSYMPTRCPGWCDRIMMSLDAPSLFHTVCELRCWTD